jgi:hypothetical protein
LRLGPACERSAPPQLAAQCEHHVEDHAHAREILARETTTRLVGIHDAFGPRQLGPGQVMVGHEHAHAQGIGGIHAGDGRDAVVHGDQQGGLELRRFTHDLGRETVAVFEAIGHEGIDDRAHRTQRAQADGARRCAVGIVVRDDDHPLAALDRVGEQARGLARMQELVGRGERGEGGRELFGIGHAARGIEAGQARIASGCDEARNASRIDRAVQDLRHGARPPCGCAASASAWTVRAWR